MLRGCPPAPPPFKKFKNKQCGVCLGTSTFVCLVTRNLLFGQDLNPISANFLSIRGLGVPGKFGYFGYTEKKHSDCFRTNAKHSFRPVLPLKPSFCFQEEENLWKCFTNGKEARFLSKKKKSSPLRFCFTKYFATLSKNTNVGQCYL